jgi:hypothetical protein|tara:strand:+ start:39 stop:1070 length:1032 start_codon:yes stop_codon:yes gene_type:complete
MSKVLRVKDGNYKIIVDNPADGSGGLITLDTTGGYTTNRGKVVITGDLEVKGIQTTVESTVTTITDNIITLNSGAGDGTGIPVALGSQGGIEIDRGSQPTARIVFNETVPFNTGGSSGTGGFIFKNEADQFLPVSFNTISAQGPLYISTPNSAINVAGTTDYEKNVFTYTGSAITNAAPINDDFIPNARGVVDYVTYSLASNLQTAIEQSDTRLATQDKSVTGDESVIVATVDGLITASFYSNRVQVSNIQILDNEISTVISNDDLSLSAPGTGSVKIKDILEITETPSDDDTLVDPTAPLEGVKIYSKTEDKGGTGIYFVNKSNTADEIISKNRALIFSMLF